MNRKQRDQNRENALRLSVVVSEHAVYPEYPNAVPEYADAVPEYADAVPEPKTQEAT